MKQAKGLLIYVYLLLFLQPLYSQIWPKTYFPNKSIYPYSILECYDKGYLIGGWYISNDGIPINGSLIKTDRNADMLWFKRFGNYNDGTSISDVTQTNDGGCVISGSTGIIDYAGDPFVMKLNACGEREWCRIYNIGKERFDFAPSIKQIATGYVVLVFVGTSLYSRDITHLYKLDLNGDMEWQQVYGQKDTLMYGAQGNDLIVTPDNQYIITGFCYYPDPDTVDPMYLRPLIIKVDSLGNAEWELPWSSIDGNSFHGQAFRSIIDNKLNIYSSGRHIESSENPPGDRPTIIKTDSAGNELLYNDLVPNSNQAVFFNLNWFQESTIALDGGWLMNYGGEGQVGVFKVDKNGNFLDSVNIKKTIYCFADAIIDSDNKLVLLHGIPSGSKWHIYTWKLNSDLEFDTLYTQPLVYDSLCPHPIVSDTIPLDCEIVGLDEPIKNEETGRLKVWPNPASDILHIMIPDKLKAVDENPVFNLTTIYHQWRSATIEIYDLFGRRMFTKEIRQGDKELETNFNSWPRGMYVVRLVYNGRTVASEKVVVE